MTNLNNTIYNKPNRTVAGIAPIKVNVYTEMVTSPITVPSDFLGINPGNYPVSFFGNHFNDQLEVDVATGQLKRPPIATSVTDGQGNLTPEAYFSSGPYSGFRGALPAPSFSLGSIRIHDCGCGTWTVSNPKQGIFDWRYMDIMSDTANTNNCTLMYTLFGTPEWAAQANMKTTWPGDGVSTPATGSSLFWRGPYPTWPGAPAPAAQNSYVTDFLTALVTRYNTGANAAAKPFGKIRYIELWNEPVFDTSVTNPPANRDSYYYWGTLQQMLSMNVAAAAAIRAVDPTVVICSPAFESIGRAIQYLSTTETVSGLKGWQIVDAVSMHPYYAHPTPYQSSNNLVESQNEYYSDNYNGANIATVQKYLASQGTSKPFYYTEFGISASNFDSLVTNFVNSSVSERRAKIIRTGLITALQGVKNIYFYSYSSVMSGILLGNVIAGKNGTVYDSTNSTTIANTTQRYPADTNGVISGMVYLKSLANKTITSGGYWSDGTVEAHFSDGTSIRI